VLHDIGHGHDYGYICIFLAPLSTIFPWRSVLLMEETGVPEENHRSGALTTITLKYLRVVKHNFVTSKYNSFTNVMWGRRGRDRMAVYL
jgi:hypothetical protein